MAYQAIINGARGLVFFGGDLTPVMRPRDAQLGWNWTFWELVLRPLLIELAAPSVRPALVAPVVAGVQASAADLELRARDDGRYLYVLAVRRSGTATNRVTFTRLPRRHNGTHLAAGEVVFEYAQAPLPPPIDPTRQVFRRICGYERQLQRLVRTLRHPRLPLQSQLTHVLACLTAEGNEQGPVQRAVIRA
jgi:hypothetical protein